MNSPNLFGGGPNSGVPQGMSEHKEGQLELPFKPFTLDEVSQITGCNRKILDVWAEHTLGMIFGSGFVGLPYMHTFAVFVGWKYLCEGAPSDRATGVVLHIASLNHDYLMAKLDEGLNFPVPYTTDRSIPKPGIMIPAPDNPMGQRLRLDKLFDEFRHNLSRQFPS